MIEQYVREVLKAWHLQGHLPQFLAPEGLVVTALLCNAAAKFIDEVFYDLKPAILEEAARQYPFCWWKGEDDDRVLYFETSVGQISFHIFDGEEELLGQPHPDRHWAGGWMQSACLKIATEYLNGGRDPIASYQYDQWLALEQASS